MEEKYIRVGVNSEKSGIFWNSIFFHFPVIMHNFMKEVDRNPSRSWFKNCLIVFFNEDIFLPAKFPREILYCIYYKNKLNH